jgi:acyl-coenzyme A thioesterase PaaI-like protein
MTGVMRDEQGSVDEVEAGVESALAELGLVVTAVGDEMHGQFPVLPTMCSPGTTFVRASVAATVADAVLGFHAIRALAPRLPVTLELDVHLFDEVEGVERLYGVSRVVKAGQSVIVTSMDFRDGGGRLVGFGSGSFMAIPNPEFTAPSIDAVLERFATPQGTLAVPLVERIGLVRTEAGTAVLPCRPVVHNGSKAINGGMLAVVAEEAALSGDPAATRIESIHVRFLRAIRVGPAVATADVHHGMARVDVRDASTDTVAAIATTRSGTR